MLSSGTSTRLRISVNRMLPGERDRVCIVRLVSVWAKDCCRRRVGPMAVVFGNTLSCSGSSFLPEISIV